MAKAEEENYWPGFVDALSTIVMVVTFLLIILAIAIFVMSLQIAQSSTKDNESKAAADTASNVEDAETVTVADDPTETPSDATTVRVLESDERFLLQFSDLTIRVDDVAKERVAAFLAREGGDPARAVVVVSYFDPSLTYTKAQRIAYYRLLGVRSALTSMGVASDRLTINVREASTLDRVNAVEISFQ